MAVRLAAVYGALCAAGAPFCSALAADGEDRRFDFAIEAPDLGSAMAALIEQTDIQLLYPYQLADATGLNPVVGSYTLDEALELMFQGTSFSAGLSERGTVTVSLVDSSIDREGNMTNGTVKKGLLASASAFLFGAAGASPSLAQDAAEDSVALDTIIVTANKREQSILDVPTSIGVVTGAEIVERGLQSLDDVAIAMPGLEIRSSTVGFSNIAIRGIAPGQAGQSATSALYVDETPYNLSTAQLASNDTPDVRMFDIERVEVLRGPQGTIYGEGAMGGMIRVVTNKPNPDRFEGVVQGQYYNYDHGGDGFTTDAVVNIPLIDGKLALRAAGYYRNDDGYIDDVLRGLEDINSFSTGEARIGLRYIDENLTVDLSYLRYDNESDMYLVLSDEDYNTTQFTDTFVENSHDVYSATIEYDFGWANLVSASSYFDREQDYITDSSNPDNLALANFALASFLTEPITAIIANGTGLSSSAFTQEIRLVSAADQRLRYTLGLFYKDSEGNFNITVDTTPSVPINLFNNVGIQEKEQYAVFGELEYDITDRLHVVGGLRWFREEQETTQTNDGAFSVSVIDVNIPLTYETIQPRFSLVYDVADDTSVYATVSKGFRAGGINQNIEAILVTPENLGGNPNVSPTFDEETLWNYEAGVKGVWFDGILSANFAAFYMDWTDLQTAVNFDNLALLYLENIASAHSAGIELEAVATPMEGLTISAGVQLLDAEIDDGAGVLPDGDELPGAVSEKFSIAAEYIFPIASGFDGFVRADYTNSDGSFLGLPNRPEEFSGGYEVTNARIGVERDGLRLEVFADNLFDEFLPSSTWPAVGTGTGKPTFFARAPRRIGVSVRQEF